MPTLLAYHNDQAIKDKYLARVTAHRAADELIQGFGYWHDGKGCAVGCTIHGSDHMAYEAELGIPVAIARLEDSIFEALPGDSAREWPGRFLDAIRPGADLSRVTPKFLYWLLTTEAVNPGINHDLVKGAIAQCVAVVKEWADSGVVNESARAAAAAAEAAAKSARAAAARSARAAAAAAAWSARAAAAAESAEWEAARTAAEAATQSAWSAAAWSAAAAEGVGQGFRSAAYVLTADKLIELLAEAPLAIA
jgi:hypothetical protein